LGDIIYPTIIGICSQIGGGSLLSIATSSSGNYDNACTADNSLEGLGVGGALNGSEFFADGNFFSAAMTIDAGELQDAVDNFGLSRIDIIPAGYLRWLGSGSPTFAWDLTLDTSSLSNSNTASVVGTASTSQDATNTTTGMGMRLRVNFDVAGKNITSPASGDEIVFAVKAQSTVGGVTSTAPKCSITLTFG
jgi:hypothetical protein|tara:strand:- start:515 stop:1090 length:576 start_codon:yes stop_codon:yes gene_type:complete